VNALLLKSFVYLQSHLAQLRTREEGQTMAEYGVVLAVICVAIITALVLLRQQIAAAIQAVVDTLADNT
jgi:Flp pilus assembly pilin Flp